MTRHFYEQHRADYLFSATVSAILIPQSYLSLEFILQQHNLLTEIPTQLPSALKSPLL
jgi:hypothetical protein